MAEPTPEAGAAPVAEPASAADAESAPETAADEPEVGKPGAAAQAPEEIGAAAETVVAVPEQNIGEGTPETTEDDADPPSDTEPAPEQSLKDLYETAPEPRQGPDSALAFLDAGQFLFGPDDLPHLGTAGRTSMTEAVPTPRPAVEDVEEPEIEAPEPEPPSEPTPPYPGAALAAEDGSAPSEEYTVKADLESKRYYSGDLPGVTAQVWFRTAEEAERAGFTPAQEP